VRRRKSIEVVSGADTGRPATYCKRLFICATLFLWQNASGINAVNYYSTTFFKSLGLTGDVSLLSTGLFGIVKTIGATVRPRVRAIEEPEIESRSQACGFLLMCAPSQTFCSVCRAR
jgi:hypothetical protein